MKRHILLIISIISILLSAKGLSASGIQKPRFVSLAPATTEILFALELDSEIVGVSSFCNYPLKAQKREKIGTFSQPNIEKIVSLKPDVVFCTGLEQAPIVEKLNRLNLKVYVSSPNNIKELFDSIEKIGAITGRQKKAHILIKSMKHSIEAIHSKTKSISESNKPKVFMEIWSAPLTTVGRDSFVDELITLAGGINIASDTKKAYSYFSPEQVIKRNPDCIILTYMANEKPIETVSRRLGWQEINAVKTKRVYNDINSDLLLRSGPRLVDGLKELHERLYP